MTGPTTRPHIRPEAPMLLVTCPLCDTVASWDTDRDALDCPVCALRLELAPDEVERVLVLAAAA